MSMDVKGGRAYKLPKESHLKEADPNGPQNAGNVPLV